MQTTSEYDVAVIGLGPVGAIVTAMLALCGLRVLAVERAHGIYDLPRAVHFDDEAMRVFQTLGIADEIAAVSRPNAGMRFVDADGRLMLDWPRPQVVGPQGWLPSWRFHQPDLERILRRKLAKMPNVTIRLGTECTGLEERGDRVILELESSGGVSTVSARAAVGCDGARSMVRQAIGGTSEDLGFNERWLVVDVLLKRDRPDLGNFTIQHCNPARPATYVRGPGNRRRWEITAKPEETDAHLTDPATVWSFLSRWITPDDADIERNAVYTFHSALAGSWRRGRLMIAGDSAHQTPPFLGQGLCAGIRDAANLAWKLAAWLRGAPDDLLDTYQSERHPHARSYVETAVRLGGLINTSATEQALKDGLRQADGSVRMESLLRPLGPGLGCKGDPHRGWLAAQPGLDDGRLMDAATGYDWVLVHDASVVAEGLGFRTIASESNAETARMLNDLSAAAVLIRPDRYIFGTARDAGGTQSLVADATRTIGSPALANA